LLALDATDVVALDIDGRLLPHRLDRIADGDSREIEATRVAPDLYVAVDGPDTAPEPPSLRRSGPLETIILDLPILRGDEIPHAPYVAAFAEPWPGAAVFMSVSGDDFRRVLTLDNPATIGRTATPFRVSAPSRWSQASLDVVLSNGALLSRDRLATLGGANAAAIETPLGWEVIQFREAILIAPRTYRLNQIIRGQAGTEPFISELPSGARFVLLDDALRQVPITQSERGLTRFIRIGPATEAHDADTYRTVEQAFDGVGLRPYAPAQLRATRDGETISLSWLRRSRIGGDHWDIEPSLGEEFERYRVTIDTGNETNIAETTESRFVFTAVDPVRITVAQVSGSYGIGLGTTLEL